MGRGEKKGRKTHKQKNEKPAQNIRPMHSLETRRVNRGENENFK